MKKQNQIRLITRIPRFVLFVWVISGSLGACHRAKSLAPEAESKQLVQALSDSVRSHPLSTRIKLAQILKKETDSLSYYKILAHYAGTFFAENKFDSASLYNDRVRFFARKQSFGKERNDLLSISENLRGNIFSLTQKMDSALIAYQSACAYALNGGDLSSTQLPDLYINLADAYLRTGRYDQSALYYRRALFVCDSLKITTPLSAIYGGLGQAYTELRDFTRSDVYYEKAEARLDSMTSSEQFFFYNNRGNHYYFKQDYEKALRNFRSARSVVSGKNRDDFSYSLCEINMGEVFLLLGQPDSAAVYLDRSFAYFNPLGYQPVLYHLASLRMELALKQGQPDKAAQILRQSPQVDYIEPNLQSIRNRYLRHFYTVRGNYPEAYRLLEANVKVDDSLRNERTRMRVEEIDMRYMQDTTLLKQNQLIGEQKAEMKELKIKLFLVIGFLIAFLGLIAVILLYRKKQRDLRWEKYMNQISRLRLESIHNRISPHFVFNVLGRVTSRFDADDARCKELSEMVGLLRRSLEMTGNVSVPLSDELEFVRTYIEIERSRMGDDFTLVWEVDKAIDPLTFKIPSFLIQIPVENAIKHGLSGVSGEKKLEIRVEKTMDGIRISIRDNGRGMQAVSQNSGTGTGFKVLYGTIQLLNSRNRNQITLSVRSIEPGTKIELLIPAEYDYTI